METVLLARKMSGWFDDLVSRIKAGDVSTFAGKNWEPSTWPKTARGYGALDAPRGALGHWVEIADGKISRYQCVVPTTWNASPRDDAGVVGPYEAALTDNHPLRESRTADRDPADGPLVRSVQRLRRPRARRASARR